MAGKDMRPARTIQRRPVRTIQRRPAYHPKATGKDHQAKGAHALRHDCTMSPQTRGSRFALLCRPQSDRCLSTVPTHPGCCYASPKPGCFRQLCTFAPLTLTRLFATPDSNQIERQKRFGHQEQTPPVATNCLRSTRAMKPYELIEALIIHNADVLNLRCDQNSRMA